MVILLDSGFVQVQALGSCGHGVVFLGKTLDSDTQSQMYNCWVLMTNESKGPQTKMLLVYVGATDSSDQPKIKYKDNKLQGFVHVCSVVFTWLCPCFQ